MVHAWSVVNRYNLNVKLIWGYQIGKMSDFFLKRRLGRGMMARHRA